MVRVCVLQPIVPSYRIPFFRALSRVPGLDIEVWADLKRPLGSLKGLRESSEFKLRHAPYRMCAGLVYQPAVIQAVRSSFDAVIVTDNVRSPSLFAALAARRTPMILWGHGFGKRHELTGHALRLLAYRSADAGLLYGPGGRSRFVEAGIDPRKLFVAPNAVDQGPIEAERTRWSLPGRLEDFRSRVGLGDNPTLLYIARLERDKLPSMAIDAFLRLRVRHPRLRLVFIGDGQERESLIARVRDAGLTSCVHFLGALYEEDVIAPWAMSATLLLHPGAIGLTVFHACGYGLPVVTSDNKKAHGPEFECLEPGVNGLIYRHGDLEDLVACCDRILQDGSLRADLSRGASATVAAPNGRSLDAMVTGFAAAIQYVTRA